MAQIDLISGHHYMVPCLRNLICSTGTYIDVKNVIYIRDKFNEPITNVGRIIFNADTITLITNNGEEFETFPRAISTSDLYIANTNGIFFEVVSTNNVLELDSAYIYDYDEKISQGSYWVNYADFTKTPSTPTANVIIDDDNRGHGQISIVLSDLTSFPLKIDLENVDSTLYTFYKNEIHILAFLNETGMYSDWDGSIDITSLCVVTETSFIIPACIFKKDSDLFTIKNHLVDDIRYVLFGGVNGGIQKVDGQSESYGEINYGEDITMTLTIPNYHFTEESYSLIYDWIIELATFTDVDGNIVNDIEMSTSGIEVIPDEDGDTTKANVIFNGVYNNLSIEDFDVFEDSSPISTGRTTKQLKLDKDFELVSTDLIGCELEQFTEEIVYKEPVIYHIIANDEYLDSDFIELRVYRDGEELIFGEDWVEDDGFIHIYEAYGEVSIVVHCSHQYTIKVYNGNQVLTFITSYKVSMSLDKDDTTPNKYWLDLGGDGMRSFIVSLPTDLDVFRGLRTRIGAWFLPANSSVDEFYLEDYAENYEVIFDTIIETMVEPTSITMALYEFNGEKTIVDKSSYLTLVGELTGTLRESCSMVSPIMTIVYPNIPTFNYVYIPNFKRYFFVTDITSVREGLWNVTLRVDVLMTYRYEIWSQKCIIARNEFDFNNLIEDVERKIQKDEDINLSYLEDRTPYLEYHERGIFIIEYVKGK